MNPLNKLFALIYITCLTATLSIAGDTVHWVESEWGQGNSSATRVDTRSSFGGCLVYGIETIGDPLGASSMALDTAMFPDGWRAQTSGTFLAALAVVNSPDVIVEEGRLNVNTTWSGSAVHLLRNNVVIPSGVTLTVSGGSIIKLTEGTQMVVEDGGGLVFNDNAINKVSFAQAEDDSVGGDTDMREAQTNWTTLAVRKFASGTVTEHGYVELNGNGAIAFETFITLSINDAQGMRYNGKAYIPVTFVGTRYAPFSIDWIAAPGTADFGTDYTLASGTLEWTSTSQGTKYIEIPLTPYSEQDDARTFTVRIVSSRGINIAKSTATVTIMNKEDDWGAEWGVGSSVVPMRADVRTSFGGLLLHGIEIFGEPLGGSTETVDTTALTDGWHTQVSGTISATFAVINSSTISIEEGRLPANTTWSADAVHLLRNNVVVPNGVTLTISGSSIIKLTEDAQIVVEDGGKLVFNDSAGNDVWFTQAEDDSIGGDTDMRQAQANWTSLAVRKFPSGTITEHGYVAMDGNGAVSFDTFISVSLNDAQVMRQNGKAYVPVTFVGTRNAPFAIDWVVEPDTAQFGTDYTQASGTLNWTGTPQGTKYIEIPLMSDNVPDARMFTVRIVAVHGVNIANATASVTILNKQENWSADLAANNSPTARIDTRASLGGYLMHGLETLGAPDGTTATQWDTTALADGWHEQTSGTFSASFAVINSATIAIEEGRLSSNTTWNAGAVHLLRNNVVIPNGVTLTVSGGSVIKLTQDTQIIVEDGGRLVFNDSAGNNVWLAQAEDDSIGGDTDMRDAQANWATLAVHKFASGTITEHGYVAMNGNGSVTLDTNIAISLNDAQAVEQSGKVFVPVTFNGTRNAPFSIDWVAEAGSAQLGSDYTQASGTLEWTSSSQGTKYIEIPLVVDDVVESPKTFTVRIKVSRAVNVAQGTATVTILDSPMTLTQQMFWAGDAESASSRADIRRGYGGTLVHGLETIGEPNGSAATQWDTATLADGWHAQSRGDQTVLLSAINSAGVSMEEGRLETNTTWTAQIVHVVRNRVIVPAGVMLTIHNGTVVKFTEDTAIIVENGGILNAFGTIFTHIADDAAGGDTNADGNRSLPYNDQYAIDGAGQILLANCYLRYRTVAIEQSGILGISQTWAGNCVHRITGDVTIPNGVTLTISEGAILKFDQGKGLTVQVGGKLNIEGSAHKQVIFTSMKDDVHGGDTNEDGNATIPQPGEWVGVINNGGIVNIQYARFYYGGYGQFANQGDAALRNNSGSLIVKNCELVSSLLRHVRAAGTVTIENTILRDARWAVDGNATLTNCVIFDCENSLIGSGQIRNSVISDCTNSPSATYSFNKCVIWKAGSAANCIVADPLFRDADIGDFTLKISSPCIDAADGAIAPERDYYGQSRATDSHVVPTGVADAAGAYPDIGVHEMTDNAVSEVDLAVGQVTIPGNANVGDTIVVKYTVTNVGNLPAEGICRNEFAMVGGFGATKVNIGAVAHLLSLQPGESIELSANITVPSLAEGDWYLQVLLNSDRSIFEGRNTDNNFYQTPEAIHISMAALSGVTTAVVNGNSSLTFRVNASTSEAGTILIHAQEGLNIYGAFGYVPGVGQHDIKAVYCGNGVYAISLPQGEGSMYVVVENTGHTDKVIQVETTDASLSIFGVSVNRIPNAGQVTFSIYGTGFTDNTTVQLRNGAQTIIPKSIKYLSPVELTVTVSPENAALGNYDIVVVDGNAIATLSGKMQVLPGTLGGVLKTDYNLPNSVRAGRVFSFPITCTNSGDADLSVPMVTLTDPRPEPSNPLEFSLDGETFHVGRLQFLSLDNNGRFDAINSKASVTTIVFCKVPNDMTGGLNVAVRGNTANDDAGEYTYDVDRYVSSSLIRKAADPTDTSAVELLQFYRTVLGKNNKEFITNLVRIAKDKYDNSETIYNDVTVLKEFLLVGGVSSRAKMEKKENQSNVKTQAYRPVLQAGIANAYKTPGRKSITGVEDVRIYVWKGNSWTAVESELIDLDDDKMNIYSDTGKIVILSHGWRANREAMSIIAEELAKKDYLVLCVDWSVHSDTGLDILPTAAKKAASFIRYTSDKAVDGLKVLGVGSKIKNRPVFIGHSHGAHVVGHIANNIGASLCIGLDTSIERYLGVRIHEVHGRDGRNSLFDPIRSNISKTIFFRSSQTNGRTTAYADENYIVVREGDFENELVSVEDSEQLTAEARHSWSKTWFVQNVVVNAGWLERLKTESYWDIVNKEHLVSNYAEFPWKGGSVPSGVFIGVLNEGEGFEVAEHFSDIYLQKNLQEKKKIEHTYMGIASKWELLHNNIFHATDLQLIGKNVPKEWLANTPQNISVIVKECINNTSLDISGLDSNGIPRNLEFSISLYEKTGTTYRNVYSSGKRLWCRQIPDGPVKFTSKQGIDFVLPEIIIPEYEVFGNGAENEKEMYLTLNVRTTDKFEVYPANNSYVEDYWSEDRNYIKITVKRTGAPQANINTHAQNGFVIENKIIYSSIEDFKKAQSSGKYTTVTLDGSASKAAQGRNINRYLWWDAGKPDQNLGTGATCAVSVPATANNTWYSVGLLVWDDANPAKTGSIIGYLHVTIDVEGETCLCPHHPCAGECNCGRCTGIPRSVDPNEISGPTGAGEQRYIVPGEWLDFKVYFENQATATGAAQEVHVNNALSQYLDWSSFELAEVSFANQIEMGLRGLKTGQIEVVQKGTSTKVRVEAKCDPVTGQVSWYMRSVDPSTADGWPLDPYAGFLLPNDATGRGEGYVAYRVKVKADAPHNARIDSSASIVFDYNDPIVTDPAWWNTVYADGGTDPVITTQPSNITKILGGSASFSVVATGYAPLSYQWYKDGVALDGKTSATLAFASVADSNAGEYTVAVTNIFKTVTSQKVSLAVITPPAIAWATNAGSQTVQDGATATFGVNITAGTAPFAYKWFKNTNVITTATTAAYTTPATLLTDNGAVYKVEVSNAADMASMTATLTVVASPATLAQAHKSQIEASGTATVTISGTIDFSLVGGITIPSGKTIVGADANTTISGGINIPAGAKNVTITGVNITDGALNIAGASVVDIMHCTFVDAPVLISGSADNVSFSWNKFTATAAGNGSAMSVSNAGAATGIILDHNLWGDGLRSDMPAVTNARVHMYDNYIAATGNTAATVAGAQAQVLSVHNIYEGTHDSLVTQSNGLVRILDNVTAATSGSMAAGTDKVFVPVYSYVAHPSGSAEPLSTNELAILVESHAGNTAGKDSYSPTTNLSGALTFSGNAMIGGGSILNATVPAGGNFMLTGEPRNFTPTSWQWYRDNFSISSATSANYMVASATASAHAGTYSVAMTAPAGEIVFSKPFGIAVGATATPSILTHPQSQTVNVGETVNFSVTATGESLTYQWLKNGTSLSGATSSAYSIANVQQAHAGNYSAMVMNTSGTVTSNVATLTVNSSGTSGNNGGGNSGGGGGGGGGSLSFLWLGAIVALVALRKITANARTRF